MRFLLGTLPVFLVSLLLLTGCGEEEESTTPRDIPFRADGVLEFVDADGQRLEAIAIEIADTDSARQRGLMDRRSLPERGGMLFIFDDADERSFWMRNTPLALDIIFVGADSQVVNIHRRTRPLADERYESEGPAQYVVEVRAGFTARYDIDEDTHIRWRRRDN